MGENYISDGVQATLYAKYLNSYQAHAANRLATLRSVVRAS